MSQLGLLHHTLPLPLLPLLKYLLMVLRWLLQVSWLGSVRARNGANTITCYRLGWSLLVLLPELGLASSNCCCCCLVPVGLDKLGLKNDQR